MTTSPTLHPPLLADAGSEAARLARLPRPALLVMVAVVYFALAQFVIWLNDPVQLGAGFWPAAGVSLALLLLLPRRTWPWVLGGVAIAEFGGDLLRGYVLGATSLWTIGNVVEPLVGALLVRRFSAEPGSLTPLDALVGFIVFGVIAGPLVGATIGSLGTIVFYGTPPELVWPKYVVGDALGVLVVAPLLLTWRHPWPHRSRTEAIVLGASATVVTVLVFRNWGVVWEVTLPYLLLPFVMWAALRFGIRGIASLSFVIANIANWATAMGYGPFAITGGTEHAVTLLQVFLGITLTTGFVLAALASDLTDTRELTRRQAEHTADVQRNREFRDAFVGVLGHEIRAPITTIYGMSQLLRKRHRSIEPDVVGQYLDDIGAESERLRRLTEDLLVLSRAEGGRLEVAENPLVIRHVVQRTVEEERLRATTHDITMGTPPALPLVLGEEVYVEQIVRNFLSNAVKYSPSGSSIRVDLTNEAGGVSVRVIDSGPGLPAGQRDRLFDLFYRDSAAVGTTAGAGIGLFVCRRLAEAMRGRVWATDGPEASGAEFGMWLPGALADEMTRTD